MMLRNDDDADLNALLGNNIPPGEIFDIGAQTSVMEGHSKISKQIAFLLSKISDDTSCVKARERLQVLSTLNKLSETVSTIQAWKSILFSLYIPFFPINTRLREGVIREIIMKRDNNLEFDFYYVITTDDGDIVKRQRDFKFEEALEYTERLYEHIKEMLSLREECQ